MEVELLTLSPEGTLELPERMRKKLYLTGGCQMVAIASIADGDGILLKPVRSPSQQDFLDWMDEAQAWAKEVGYREEDVERIIKEVRSRA